MCIILDSEDNVGDYTLIIVIVILLVVLFLLGVFGWLVYKKCMRNRLPKKKGFFDFLRCSSVLGCHFMKKKVLRKPHLKIFSR